MFSFFKRNKPKQNQANNEQEASPKVSLNIQLAIEKQQESLQKILDQKRNKSAENYNEDSIIRSATLPAIVGEVNKSNVLFNPNAITFGARAQQNYDQHRDSKRASYSTPYDHFITSRQGNAAPSHNYSNTSSPVTVVASSSSLINDRQQHQTTTTADTDSDHTSIQFDEVMGKGRNRNRYNNNHNNYRGPNNNNNNNNVKKPSAVITQPASINSNIPSQNQIHQEYSENAIATNSEQYVPHGDENSCAIFKAKVVDNTNSSHDDEEKTNDVKCGSTTHVAAVATSDDDKNAKNENNEHNEMPNDEHHCQQVAELQRTASLKRVHFAPSPPVHHKNISVESNHIDNNTDSSDDDDEEEEEETISSEDIFYEAEAPSEQKLRILSTVTSHQSSKFKRIDEEEISDDENDAISNECSTSSSSSSASTATSIPNSTHNNNNNNNDVVCAKIILSVDDENETIKGSSSSSSNNNSNDSETVDIQNINAFSSSGTGSSEENSISNDDVPKTIKPSYMLVGDDAIALPDIVSLPDILLEQQQHINVDEVANIVSHASSYAQHGNGNSISSNQIEIVDQMQVKVNELCMKIDQLEIELNIKSGTVDRLQSELESANKEGDCVRQRLRFQNDQLEQIKEKHDLEIAEEHKKFVMLEAQYKDSMTKLQKMQNLASNLNVQLAQASVDIEKLRMERDELLDKLTAQEKLLRDILETAAEEREQIAAKWKHEFEQLRNVNCSREETLMEDCEWKLRQLMKQCKEKIEKAEKEKLALKDQAQIDKQTIRSQRDEIKSLKAAEKEASQLRGLTNEQRDSMSNMLKRIESLNNELESVKKRLQTEIDSCLQIKRDCSYQLSERERAAANRIEIARGEVAMEWEDRLMQEMSRLKSELEQVHIEERNLALAELKSEHMQDLQNIAIKYKEKEDALAEELTALRKQLDLRQEDLRELQLKADNRILEHRAYIERRERDHQKELDKQQLDFERQLRQHTDLIEEIKDEHKREKEQIKASFYKSLEQIKEEFANEITLATETLQAKHKKEMEEQWKQLVQEKESALQAAENKLRIKMEDADNKLSSVMIKHQRQLKDERDQFDIERSRFETRDVQNAQEIDTLHRKCICLTKLFEEMRIRYERRDPRPEDIRRIDELKSIVDSQERDICSLTEKLRELQLQYQQSQQTQNNQANQQNSNQSNKRNKGKNNNNSANKNNRGNNNGNSNNAQQMRNNQQQQQQAQNQQQRQRVRPPPLIKTVIYEEENEDELYEEQLREERENATRHNQSDAVPIPTQNSDFTVELVPESPDYTTKNGNLEEISEALIVPEHEIMNQRVIPSPTPDDFKNQEIAVEVITTIEPSHIQIIPMENGLDLELD